MAAQVRSRGMGSEYVIDLFRLNNKFRSKCGDCIQDATILYAVSLQNQELRQFTKDGGGGSVRPKTNILTYNQPNRNPFCLYPKFTRASTRDFSDQRRTPVTNSNQ
jgi:hypothetical protein